MKFQIVISQQHPAAITFGEEGMAAEPVMAAINSAQRLSKGQRPEMKSSDKAAQHGWKC